MSSEYVKLTRPEVVYGGKHLLQTQIEILQLLAHYREYEKCRKEEMVLKIALKAKVEEMQSSLHLLDKLLPKVVMPQKSKDEYEQPIERSKDTLSLEQEIDKIRQKLAKLR